jgi:hypothetical protein
MPLICTFQVALQKYATTDLKVTASDFTFASYFFMASITQVVGIVMFYEDDFEFTWKYWTIGFVASLTNVLGSFFVTAAISTGSAVGPIIALVNC